ncbi:MAG: HD domain-containing phosphohydrolase [Candidatus Omnitrophota bacterium]
MKRDSEGLRFLFIGLCAAIIIYSYHSIAPPHIWQSINDISLRYIYSLSRKSIQFPKFIGIAVDEYSLDKIPQRWPWKRSLYAQLLKILEKEKLNTVGFDFVFLGESEDKDDDRLLKEALDSASGRVVLTYFLDFEKLVPVLPLAQFQESAYALGMLNTPVDGDGNTRRLRGYLGVKGVSYYSFSVALSASFLKQNPKDLIPLLPLAKDRTFFINYLLKPKDIITLSFYDVITDLEGLKQRYGNDFLRDALVLVYPEAEILHDTYNTPLGKMPGGILHLNGAANIISGRLLKENNILLVTFLIFSFLLIFYILRYCSLIMGVLFTLGVFALNFWGLVFLSLKGLKFDYASVVIFSLTFFILGNLYRYTHYLTQILKIKDRATLDPFTTLFTLRYFYYRLVLERKKIYFHKDLFLVVIYLESFKELSENMPLEKIRDIWQKIALAVSSKGILWSVYSQDELAGCIVGSQAGTRRGIDSLKNSLGALLYRKDIKPKIKFAYVKLKKHYPAKELLFILSSELKKKKREIVLFEDYDLAKLLESSGSEVKQSGKILDILDQDIEERNRQLLSLVQDLNKEHAKTKEAFFQIIGSLVNALEARDSYTEGHSQRVANYALMIAEKLNWPTEQKEKLKKAALLHDLGKIGIPDKILHKRERLTEEEYDVIKKHEIFAVNILEPLKDLSEILPWILYHHERWDGKGYPHGLAGDAIPEAAQIISLADVFDALTTGRDYKVAFAVNDSIRELIKNKGTQFNPRLTDVFVEVILNPRPK